MSSMGMTIGQASIQGGLRGDFSLERALNGDNKPKRVLVQRLSPTGLSIADLYVISPLSLLFSL